MAKIVMIGSSNQGEDKYLLSTHHTILSPVYTVITNDRDYLIISSSGKGNVDNPAYDIYQGWYSRSLIKDMLTKFNINTPKAFFNYSDQPMWLHPLFNTYDKLAIKSNLSNRGLAKSKITLNQYLKLIDLCRSKINTFDENDKLTSKAKQFFKILDIKDFGDYENDNEKYGLLQVFIDNDIHVEEVVDIDREFRIHYVRDVASDEYTGYERFGYSLNYDPEKVKDVMRDISTCVPVHLLDKIKQLGDSTKSITLSFDVYQTKDGSWGVIEFASNYSLDGCNGELVKKLSRQYNDALDNMYKEKYCQVEEYKLGTLYSESIDDETECVNIDFSTTLPFIKFPLKPNINRFELNIIDNTLKTPLPVMGKVLDSRTIKILDVEYGFRIVGNDLDHIVIENGADVMINTYEDIESEIIIAGYNSINYCISVNANSITIPPKFIDNIRLKHDTLLSNHNTYGIYIYKK